MKAIALILGATTLALASCAPLAGAAGGIASIPRAPVEVADRTVLDEGGLLGLEVAYKIGRLLAEKLTDAGVIRGSFATRISGLNDTAFRSLGVARRAYAAGNAESYEAALKEGRAAIDEVANLISTGG